VPFVATVLHVLVASPSDPVEERRAVQQALQTYNVDSSEETGVVLLPLLYEDRCYPLQGDRPQALVNQQIVDRSDLVVAIFKASIGTPTGVAASGTVEEIDRLLAAGKPVTAYFHDGAIPITDIDLEELGRLNDLQGRLRDAGLVGDYDSPGDLREKLPRHLRRLVRDHYPHLRPVDESQRQELARLAKEAATELLLSVRR
jgi:hypothetical protein